MNKTEQLLKMLEHPEQYTEQQWQDILADMECRELYSLMAETRSALAGEQADEWLADEMIDEQWERLAAEHPRRATIVPLWRKVAAAAVVVVACVGIAIAAVHTGLWGFKSGNTPAGQVTEPKHGQDGIAVQEHPETPADTAAVMVQPRLFDEVPLDQILAELAPYYGVTVEYRSDDVRHLRLFYQWEPEYSIDKVVEMLNTFEAFYIHREGSQLIVEPS
jgi:hypothetical protein